MKYLFGNWKMYLDYAQSLTLAKHVGKVKFNKKKVAVTVFPTFLAIPDAVKVLKKTNVKVGAQNVSWTPQGAYTGAVSAYLVKRAGVSYAIVGHSERRYIFGEHDEDVRKKVEACLATGVTPVVCVGETKEDLDNDKRQYRLKKQLHHIFDDLKTGSGKVIVAYEPVWAIGTGNPCDAATADDVIGWIKQEIKQYTSATIPVLYGGSVDASNVVSYLSRDVIDGFLVGGASTNIRSYTQLLRAVDAQA